MTHCRQDSPWRVPVDSLSADTSLVRRTPATAHFEAGPSNVCGPLGGLPGIKDRRTLAAVSSPRGRPGIESP
jgi:hypothetical protein